MWALLACLVVYLCGKMSRVTVGCSGTIVFYHALPCHINQLTGSAWDDCWAVSWLGGLGSPEPPPFTAYDHFPCLQYCGN